MKDYEHVLAVGVELEGRWEKIPDIPLHKDISIHDDAFSKSKYIGELISKPYDNLDEMFTFMEKYWPNESSDRCGFHVHFSLNDFNAYSALMEKEFFDVFSRKIKAWAENFPVPDNNFWSRFNGDNKYCRNTFMPDVQVSEISKGEMGNEKRYTHLNYCFAMHKTVECRLFPMFKDFKTGKSATETLLKIANDYLKENSPKDVEKREELTLEQIEKEMMKTGGMKIDFNADLNNVFNFGGLKIPRLKPLIIQPELKKPTPFNYYSTYYYQKWLKNHFESNRE